MYGWAFLTSALVESSQFHAPASLLPGNAPAVTIGSESGWAPEPVWTWNSFAYSNTGIIGSNPTRGMDVWLPLLHVFVFLFIGRGLATGWSAIQGILPSVYRITKLGNWPGPNSHWAMNECHCVMTIRLTGPVYRWCSSFVERGVPNSEPSRWACGFVNTAATYVQWTRVQYTAGFLVVKFNELHVLSSLVGAWGTWHTHISLSITSHLLSE
jgi:hypothetical protein